MIICYSRSSSAAIKRILKREIVLFAVHTASWLRLAYIPFVMVVDRRKRELEQDSGAGNVAQFLGVFVRVVTDKLAERCERFSPGAGQIKTFSFVFDSHVCHRISNPARTMWTFFYRVTLCKAWYMLQHSVCPYCRTQIESHILIYILIYDISNCIDCLWPCYQGFKARGQGQG